MSKFILIVSALFLFNLGYGQNIWTGTTNTDWETATNWSSGHKPLSTEDVVIPNVPNKPVISVAGAECNMLSLSNTTLNSTVSLTIIGSGTLAATSIRMNDTGNDTSICSLRISIGKVSVTGSIVMSGAASRNNVWFSGVGTLNIGGTMSGGGFNPGAGLINYNNIAAQTVGSYTYNDLTVSGGGVKTTNGVTVNGIFSLEGDTTLAVSTLPTYGSSATLQYNSASALTAGPEWPSFPATGRGFFSLGGIIISNTGLVSISGGAVTKIFEVNVPLKINSGASLSSTGGTSFNFGGDFINLGGTFITDGSVLFTEGSAQNIGSFTTTDFVRLAKTAGTVTFTGNINAARLVMINDGGTLNLGANLTHTFSENWMTNNGILNGGSSLLRIGGNVTGTGGTFIANEGTVEFYAGNQSLGTAALAYNNLILSGSGTKTFGSATTINNTWSIATGVVADLSPNLVHTATKLVLGGAETVQGSWGSTASNATNKNDTFFALNNGIINGGAAIAVNGTLAALNTPYGTPSASTTFNVSGAAMEEGIVVTSPAGFEVSTDNITFYNTLAIGAAGAILPTPVYVRLKGTIDAGDYSGDIVLSSSNTTTVNVPVVISTVTRVALTITADNKDKAYGDANPVLTASYVGFIDRDTVASLTTLPTITTTAIITSEAGPYPITAIGAISANYEIFYVEGTLRVLSTNANLANLTVSDGVLNPLFSKDITSYNVSVGNEIITVTITPTAEDLLSAITVNGVPVASGRMSNDIDLIVGQNTIVTQVTAADGLSTKTYTVTIVKAASSEAGLANLTINEGTLNQPFNTDITNYTDTVQNGISSIVLNPSLIDPAATISINGIATNNNENFPVDLNVGDNTITIVVTAQDGTQKTYVVDVFRAANPNEVVANNIISPNGDGRNDYWKIKDINFFPNNSVKVFDRAGRIVYSKNNYNNEWDGSYNGSPLSSDTYYYLIDLGAGLSKIKGFITIIRD